MGIEKGLRMKAKSGIERYRDITRSIPPLAFALYSWCLSSHCSSCSSPLPNSHPSTSSPSFLNYCSNPKCASTDTPIHHNSAEHHLFQYLNSNPDAYSHPDTSDLRLALRLLLLLPADARLAVAGTDRLLGLSVNDVRKFCFDLSGATVIAKARAMRDGKGLDYRFVKYRPELSVLSLVMTNAVEVIVDGEMPVGVAVYDWRFSWINHSCSPNSCFRFVHAFEAEAEEEEEEEENPESMRIVPFGGRIAESGACTASELPNGNLNYSPRVIVRTIKALERDEEVTITYTDLLQQKGLRNSDLLHNYQFTCDCRRCSGRPDTYVEHALEERIVCTDHHNTGTCSLNKYHKHDRFNAIDALTEMFNITIQVYMEVGDPVKCCNNIEALLSEPYIQQHMKETDENSFIDFRLSPLHYLSISGYTTLISTHKMLGNLRTSVAYSMLLAGATHHLFLSERALVVSAMTFWIDAGKSLVYLARNTSWSSIENCTMENLSTIDYIKCPSCSLMDLFESNYYSSQTQPGDFDDISREFLVCMSVFTPRVWRFLVQGCQFLEDVIKDPIDFSWLGGMRSSDMLDLISKSNYQELSLHHGSKSGENCVNHVDEEEQIGDVRSNVFRLGVHCLLYGGYLSSTCYGCFHPKTRSIRSILYN